MSKHKNRLAQFQAQDFQEDVTRFKIQRLKRFLNALAEVKEHGVAGEIIPGEEPGSCDIDGRLRELVDSISDLTGLTADQVFQEIIAGALERWDRAAGEEGLAE